MVSSRGDRGRQTCVGDTRETARAMGSVLGVALVFGMVLAGSFAVVAIGSTMIEDTGDRLSVQRAEKALTEFDSDAALVALGNTDIQEVSFGDLRASEFETQNGTGWMMVTIDNQTSGTSKRLLNQSLGAITFEGEESSLAYQGGGVWKQSGNGSAMVSPPEFHFRNGTLTLPVVNVTGSQSIGRRASIRHEETIKKFPDPSVGDRNPLTNHLVTVTVKSEYYRAWGRYFEERTDGEVEYDHDRELVNLTLLTPVRQRKITAASASLSASGTFNVSGNPLTECGGTRDPFTDSYNSSQAGTYCTQTQGTEGDLIYGKDIDISGGGGNSDFLGNLSSGRNVTVNNNIDVHGNINFTDHCIAEGGLSDCSDAIVTGSGGTVNEIDGIEEARQINYYVQNRVDAIEDSNDNNDTGVLITSSDRLDFGGTDTVGLTEGTYYLDRIDLDDAAGRDELVLDTTGGPVTLAIGETIELGDDTEIEIIGDGTVRIFVAGENAGGDPHLRMEKDTEIANSDDDATQTRIYGQSNFTAEIGESGGGTSNPAEYVGVIYAPPGSSGSGNVTLEKGAVYGGILTGTTTIPSGGRGSIHYDEALEREQIISPNAKILKITYLHVSINRIHVE